MLLRGLLVLLVEAWWRPAGGGRLRVRVSLRPNGLRRRHEALLLCLRKKREALAPHISHTHRVLSHLCEKRGARAR